MNKCNSKLYKRRSSLMNKLVKNPESVNKELNKKKNFLINFKIFFNRIKCSQSPAIFFNYHANYINYLQFRNGKDLDFTHKQIQTLYGIFHCEGFNLYYLQNKEALERHHSHYLARPKKQPPDFPDKRYYRKDFKHIASIHDMSHKMGKIAYHLTRRTLNLLACNQAWLAEDADCCRQYVNECMQEFRKRGWIKKIGEREYGVYIYEVSHELKDFYRACFDKNYYAMKRKDVKKVSLETMFQKDDNTINSYEYIDKELIFNRETENKILYWCPKYRPIIFEERRKRKDFKNLLPNYLFCSQSTEKPRDNLVDYYKNIY